MYGTTINLSLFPYSCCITRVVADASQRVMSCVSSICMYYWLTSRNSCSFEVLPYSGQHQPSHGPFISDVNRWSSKLQRLLWSVLMMNAPLWRYDIHSVTAIIIAKNSFLQTDSLWLTGPNTLLQKQLGGQLEVKLLQCQYITSISLIYKGLLKILGVLLQEYHSLPVFSCSKAF